MTPRGRSPSTDQENSNNVGGRKKYGKRGDRKNYNPSWTDVKEENKKKEIKITNNFDNNHFGTGRGSNNGKPSKLVSDGSEQEQEFFQNGATNHVLNRQQMKTMLDDGKFKRVQGEFHEGNRLFKSTVPIMANKRTSDGRTITDHGSSEGYPTFAINEHNELYHLHKFE